MPSSETRNSAHPDFAAIPVRAIGDTRLSATDHRVLQAIAYHDRFGRNGCGCYADPRKLAKLVGVRPAHWSRHTNRLLEFGYIEIEVSVSDRRRREYTVIYDDVEAGAAADTVSTKAPAEAEKATNVGVIHREIVTNADFQAIDPQKNSDNLIDPVKQRENIPRSGCSFGHKSGREFSGLPERSSYAPFAAPSRHEPDRQRLSVNQSPTVARQRRRAGNSEHRQRELPVLFDPNQRLRAQRLRQAAQRLDQDIQPFREWYEDALRHGFEDVRQRAIAIEAGRPGAGIHYVKRCIARAEKTA
jgi:hypothetical protein